MLEGLDTKMLGSSLKLTDFATLVLLWYTLTFGLGVITGVWMVSLGGTMGLEVILVNCHFVPLIVKVLPVDCDPLALVEGITHVEDKKVEQQVVQKSGKPDVIVVVRNVIPLFKLVIRSSPGRNDRTTDLSLARETQLVVVVTLQEIDKQFVELMVVGELLKACNVDDEKVLHKFVNVVEMDNTVEQLVITIVDSN
uniref:Uncharacterized protein n=1 Tax=Tanacetum cinerariifolium TaxID=118510 RepID=A0A6L2J9J7_TANCI|nr:hypothetical protein [Tanacetum cinerariifolium]